MPRVPFVVMPVGIEGCQLLPGSRLDMSFLGWGDVPSVLRAGGSADSQTRMLGVVVGEAFGALRPSADMPFLSHA